MNTPNFENDWVFDYSHSVSTQISTMKDLDVMKLVGEALMGS